MDRKGIKENIINAVSVIFIIIGVLFILPFWMIIIMDFKDWNIINLFFLHDTYYRVIIHRILSIL